MNLILNPPWSLLGQICFIKWKATFNHSSRRHLAWDAKVLIDVTRVRRWPWIFYTDWCQWCFLEPIKPEGTDGHFHRPQPEQTHPSRTMVRARTLLVVVTCCCAWLRLASADDSSLETRSSDFPIKTQQEKDLVRRFRNYIIVCISNVSFLFVCFFVFQFQDMVCVCVFHSIRSTRCKKFWRSWEAKRCLWRRSLDGCHRFV